jgi:hypothetical protein
MIKEIVQYIENETDFTIGTDLFAGYIPSTITGSAVVAIESGGATEHELPDYIEKRVQVLSRSENYWTAKTNAQTVFDLLHGIAGITLPDVSGEEYYVDVAQAVTAPQSLGQDEKGLWQISTNYVFKIQDK